MRELKHGPQALFVDAKGIYPALLGADRCWDVERDARTYAGDDPVVAHPPCQLWVNMAAVNWKRYGRQKPAWYTGGTDEGCFLSAYLSVRRFGGVLEHPAGSHAWGAAYDVSRPPEPGRWWAHSFGSSEPGEAREAWVCEVWQSAYGHAARKRTWLMYCGRRPPFELNWTRAPGTHQVGWFDRNKPTLSKREASATPRLFAEALIHLAEWSRGE
jgi:hypothetical protein